MIRRQFLRTAAGACCAFASRFHHAYEVHDRARHVGLESNQIETDSGLYGIGEAYWGWGVKDLVLNNLRPIVVWEDPLNVVKLYTKLLMEGVEAGALGSVTMTAERH